MLAVGTACEVLDNHKKPIRTGRIAGPLTRVEYLVGTPTYAYPVELDKGFYSTDGLTFIKIMLVNPSALKTDAKYPCQHCGSEMDYNRPSGVCSSVCLNQAQGFAA